jgi:hypothetical protein
MAGGSPAVLIGPLARLLEARSGELRVGDWRTQPEPSPQEAMPAPAEAPPLPAVAERAVPQRVPIRDARALEASAPSEPTITQEVTVLGLPLAAGVPGILIGLYAYALPLILYSAWVSIALWDLARQEAVPNAVRIGWMAAVLALPVVGPVAYYVAGRSPIQRSLRVMLVGGGVAIYVAIAAIGVALGSA